MTDVLGQFKALRLAQGFGLCGTLGTELDCYWVGEFVHLSSNHSQAICDRKEKIASVVHVDIDNMLFCLWMDVQLSDNRATECKKIQSGSRDKFVHLHLLLCGLAGGEHRPLDIGSQVFTPDAGQGFDAWAVFGGYVFSRQPIRQSLLADTNISTDKRPGSGVLE